MDYDIACYRFSPLFRGSGGRDMVHRRQRWLMLSFSPLFRGSGGRDDKSLELYRELVKFQSSVSRKWGSRHRF